MKDHIVLKAPVQVVYWLKVDHPIHLTFILGFYVSLVVKRWWEQYVKLPSPDEVAIQLKAGITRNDAGENLRMRKTVVRYMVLSYLLCMRRISSSVRNKYPTMEHVVATKLLRKDEVFLCQCPSSTYIQQIILVQAVKIGLEGHNAIQQYGKSNWWLPIKWSIGIVKRAMAEDRVAHPPSYATLVKAIAAFRANLTDVLAYGHVTPPLVYTQVCLPNYFHVFGRSSTRSHKKSLFCKTWDLAPTPPPPPPPTVPQNRGDKHNFVFYHLSEYKRHRLG